MDSRVVTALLAGAALLVPGEVERLDAPRLHAELRGQVLGAQERPVPDVAVTVAFEDRPWVRTRTDEQGRFTARTERAAMLRYVVVDAGPASMTTRVDHDLRMQHGDLLEHTYSVDPASVAPHERNLHLRAVGPDGLPLARLALELGDGDGHGVRIRLGFEHVEVGYVMQLDSEELWSREAREQARPATTRAYTDEHGELRLHGLPPAPLVVTAFRRDPPPGGLGERPAHRFEIDLRRQPVGVVELVVPEDPPPTTRALELFVLASSATPRHVVFPKDPRGPEREDDPTLALLWRRSFDLRNEFELRFDQDAAGRLEAAMRRRSRSSPYATHFEGDGEGTRIGGDSRASRGDRVRWLVPLGAGELTVDVPGLGAQSVAVPAGTEDFCATFVFRLE